MEFLYKKEIIKNILSKFGLPKGKKVNTAKIPLWIIKSNKKIIEAFIRGLFDTDGGIFCQKDYTKYANEYNSKYHTKIRLRFTTVSKKLNEEIFKLMKGLGYRCVKRTIKKGYQNGRNNNDVQILEINEIDSIKKFFKEIKSSNLKHLTKYLIWKKFGFCPPKTTLSQRKDILKNIIHPYDLYKQE
jgi:intein/homing endonuclease